MALDLHGIMQYTTDADQVWKDLPIENEVSRPANNSGPMACPVATVAEMVATYTQTEFRPRDNTGKARCASEF